MRIPLLDFFFSSTRLVTLNNTPAQKMELVSFLPALFVITLKFLRIFTKTAIHKHRVITIISTLVIIKYAFFKKIITCNRADIL